MKKYLDKMYKKSKNEFLFFLYNEIEKKQKRIVVTANPETLMIASENENFDKILMSDKTSIIPDGIGVIMGAKRIGLKFEERIPGIEIAEELLKYASNNKKSMFFLGAKPEVMNKFIILCEKNYPNLKIAGYSDGYVKNKDLVMESAIKLKPDIILVGLGIPNQELLINKHFDNFKKGIFIGVGGTFDVLSGTLKRAPKIFIKLNLEWLYRLFKEPKRIVRFYNSNFKFLFRVGKK